MLHNIQCFLGFANFYRQFIQDFSKLATLLYKLTQKNVNFIWNKATQHAFDTLRQAFTSVPILAHINPNEQFTLATDSSDFALEAILSQVQKDNQLHPVAFSQENLHLLR